MAYDIRATEAYIRQAAVERGIDPDTAVRVAKSEGLAPGVYQSKLGKGGTREPSFGPFQLLVGGDGTSYPAGMGNDFIAQTGLDPRDPSTVPQQVDFALDNAAKNGWGAWYGAAKSGIGNRDGIGGNAAPQGTSTRELNMGSSQMAAGYPIGGLGGLGGMMPEEEVQPGIGGFLNSGNGGDLLQALGMSLMSSPSNNPFAGVAETLPALQKSRMTQQALDLERQDKQQSRVAMQAALMQAGFSQEQAAAYADSPQAATVAAGAMSEQQKLDRAAAVARSNREFGAGAAGILDGGDPMTATDPTTAASPVPRAGVSGGVIADGVDPSRFGEPVGPAGELPTQAVAPSAPASASTFGTPNQTVNVLMAKRDKLVRYMATAPSDDARASAKYALDTINQDIDRYAPTPEMKEYNFAMLQRAQQGLETVSYEEWARLQNKSKSQTINVGTEGDAFYKTLDEKQAARWDALSSAGVDAQRRMVQVDQLEGLLGTFETGGGARFKQMAGEFGIETENLSEIQAADALINKLVPSERAPGSGTMSDGDVALYKRSVPRILNQPGGNKLIIETAREIAAYDQAMGDIADRVADRSIKPSEARDLIKQLQNPITGFRAKLKDMGGNGGGVASGKEGRAAPLAPGAFRIIGTED